MRGVGRQNRKSLAIAGSSPAALTNFLPGRSAPKGIRPDPLRTARDKQGRIKFDSAAWTVTRGLDGEDENSSRMDSNRSFPVRGTEEILLAGAIPA